MKKFVYPLSFIAGLLLLITPVFGQYEWSNLGPDNLGSVTRAIVELPDGRIMAGSQGGGLWVSENRGVSWSRLQSYDDAGGNPNITSIAVDPGSGHVYVATGAVGFRNSYLVRELNVSERNYDFRADPEGFKGYLDGLPGSGVWIWDGSSWSNNNGTTNSFYGTLNYKGPFVGIQKISISSGRIFLATFEGVYYSDDPSLAFGTIFPSEGSDVFKESIVYDIEKADGNVVFAGTHNVRNPDSLYVSTDNGATFTASTDPIFYAGGTFSFGRTSIAVSPQDPSLVYVGGTSANGDVNGIFRSTNNGQTWASYAPKGSPGFTPLGSTGRDAFVLEVFPDNPDELIIAGQNWYTFLSDRGWTQTAQHVNPTATNFIPRNMYSVLFLDGGSTIFVGTENQITRSEDRGETFSLKSKGYESSVTFSVASSGYSAQDAVIAGTQGNGTIYNQNYNSPVAALRQGFGSISNNDYGLVAASAAYPGILVSQGSDGGVVRSLNSGENFEVFYGSTISPQVAGLANPTVDTLIDREDDQSGGGVLFDSRVAAQTVWALDERVPQNLIDDQIADKERIQEESEIYLFFCSGKYLWVANGIFGDALQVKWNRVTNQLVDGIGEFITAIAVSNDPFHTVWIGSSQGNLWRIVGAHDLETFNASTGVIQINTQGVSNLANMNGRWISDIAVDPVNPANVAITYAGYGGDVAGTESFVWMTQTGISTPAFYPVFRDNQPAPKEPMYAVEFARGSNGSVLFLGTESRLYSLSNPQLIANSFINASWRDELGGVAGSVPIYDIHVRNYSTTLTDEETLDFRVSDDNTVFVATHGRGVWSTASLSAFREGETVEEELTVLDQVIAYPNPVTDGVFNLGVSASEESEVTVTLMSLDGRVVAVESASTAGQEAILSVDASKLAQGYYLYKAEVINSKGTETYRGKVLILE